MWSGKVTAYGYSTSSYKERSENQEMNLFDLREMDSILSMVLFFFL
jgi:hypothetical protein